jgi:hypothetical protein
MIHNSYKAELLTNPWSVYLPKPKSCPITLIANSDPNRGSRPNAIQISFEPLLMVYAVMQWHTLLTNTPRKRPIEYANLPKLLSYTAHFATTTPTTYYDTLGTYH